MTGSLQLSGAPPQKQPRFVPLYQSRYFSGLVTQRSPLRSAGSAYEERYLGTRADALIDGSNCEITPRLTLARRPGNPVYNSSSFSSVDAFYSFREFSATTEQIRVMVDTASALYDGTGSSKTLVFTKTSGAGQSFMQSVGNNLFFANGIDQKKWVQSLFTRNASGSLPNIADSTTLSIASTPFLSTYLIDSNGNLQQLLATKLATISNVAYVQATNLLTLTVDAAVGSAGDLQVCWDLGTATWLNGITIEVVSASGTTITANLLNETHADYASTADTGYVAQAVGGSPTTGGSVPTWNTNVPSSSNNFQGGITLDGTALWVNRGSPVENWGISILNPGATTAPAPTATVGNSTSSWHSSTFYSPDGVIIDSNGNLQQVTTAGKSGSSAPTWNTIPSGTTNDGTVVWTLIQSAASLTWSAHTQYAAGSYIVASTGGTNCLFKLAAFKQPTIVQQPASPFAANTSTGDYVRCYFYTTSGNPGVFTPSSPTVGGAAATSNLTSVLFNIPASSDPALLMTNFALNNAGEVTGSSHPFAGANNNWSMVAIATINIPVAGSYSISLSHDDGAIIGFSQGNSSGSLPQLVSGPTTTFTNHTLLNNYTMSGLAGTAGVNQNGNYSDSIVVNFPTADTYNMEIDYFQWQNEQTLQLQIQGYSPAPIATGSGPESMTHLPTFPAWTTAYAPNYPSVTEKSSYTSPTGVYSPTGGMLVWQNHGPVADFVWSPNTNFTLPGTTITDPNNNTEAPYRTGVSGTTIPTFSTGLNQLTLDNPNLIWINQGPAAAPAPGTISAFNGGYQYTVALVNTMTDTVSNASQVSVATGNFIGASGVTISGGLPDTANIDPQSDFVAIFRTTDGQAVPFLIPGTGNSLYTIPLSTYLQDGYVDTADDTQLNNLIEAPILGENTPPASGAKNLTFHLSRIWFSIGNTVYWTSGPDAPVGNGIEGVSPLNFQTFPSLVNRIVPTTIGAFVYTVSDIYLIIGQGTATNPIQPAYPYLQGIGLLSYNALDVNGADQGFFSSDKRFIVLNPSSGPQDAGFAIGNKLQASGWNAANVYTTWHSSGEDSAWFLSDGSTGWYRITQTPSPEQGVTVSPFATITSGIKAVQSIETSPGVHNLLSGPSGTGPILNRSLTSFLDDTTPYTWSATLGSMVLANPGQLAEVAFISTDCVATGSRPALSVILNEAVPYYTGPFDALNHFTDDPPNFPSTSTYAQRWYLTQTEKPAKCRHMQIRLDFPAENFQNELLTLTLFGALLTDK